MTVRCLERAIGRNLGVGIAPAPRNVARTEPRHDLIGSESHDCIEQSQIDVLPLSGALAVRDRGADREARVHAGENIRYSNANLLRPTAWRVVALPRYAHEPAHTLEDEIVSRPLSERAILSISGDGAVDDRWVDFLDICVREPERLEHADLVVLDEHLGFCCERADDFLAGRRLDVNAYGLFVAVRRDEVCRLAGIAAILVLHEGRSIAARVVADARLLDLDDLGAEIGEILRGPRSCQDSAQIEYANV